MLSLKGYFFSPKNFWLSLPLNLRSSTGYFQCNARSIESVNEKQPEYFFIFYANISPFSPCRLLLVKLKLWHFHFHWIVHNVFGFNYSWILRSTRVLCLSIHVLNMKWNSNDFHSIPSQPLQRRKKGNSVKRNIKHPNWVHPTRKQSCNFPFLFNFHFRPLLWIWIF